MVAQENFKSNSSVLTFIYIAWVLFFYTLTFLDFTRLLISCFTCELHLSILNFRPFWILWKLVSLFRAWSFRRNSPHNKSFAYFLLWTCILNILCWMFRFHDDWNILHSHCLFHASLHFSIILYNYNTLLNSSLF